jgi:hypothetical protein
VPEVAQKHCVSQFGSNGEVWFLQNEVGNLGKATSGNQVKLFTEPDILLFDDFAERLYHGFNYRMKSAKTALCISWIKPLVQNGPKRPVELQERVVPRFGG